MRVFIIFFCLWVGLESAFSATWPIELKTQAGGTITIYQPQPETMTGNKITGRAAFSAKRIPGDELVFGVFWYTAALATDRDSQLVTLEKILVTDVKLPDLKDPELIAKLKTFLETEIPKGNITASLDDIKATIERELAISTHEYKNDPPEILFKSLPAMLVIIDGEPKLVQDEKLKMKRVINTAFVIVENPADKKYYLYGGTNWYASSNLTQGYSLVTELPANIKKIDDQFKKDQGGKPQAQDAVPPAIVISTKPAELIQSSAEPEFASIEGTSLLYVSNSGDNIFKSVEDQSFYVLLSGRWYESKTLSGPWTFRPADKLPKDFAAIPEGSAKDKVLASVPGTQASKDALMDAQIPQTAKVDRKKAAAMVTYDGMPKFEPIEGTSLELAMNTKSTVLKSGTKYYCVETGIWFVATGPAGPWKVSDERPKDVEKIPPSSPAYNAQYVYIYDTTPESVYVGYTPGYMGCYVYGGTVIYGTGYYYTPWYGAYYYPHPMTYGYGMAYNPWCGWSMGMTYSTGCFSISIYGGGYWGPPLYRPPYYPPHHGGIYGGRGPTYIHNGDININRDRSNNVYNGRNDVSTNDVRRGDRASQLPADDRRGSRESAQQQPADNRGQGRDRAQQTGPRNDMYAGRNGEVYQRQDNGNWNQRNGGQWQQAGQNDMNRDFQNRERSANQNRGFEQMNRGGNMGGGFGGRGVGGGGRRR